MMHGFNPADVVYGGIMLFCLVRGMLRFAKLKPAHATSTTT